MRSQRPACQPAFTLIELLVVVAIITLLISILTPSLSEARKRAKGTKCKASLRQLGVGMMLYLEEYDGLPANTWRLADGTRFRWFNAMAHLLAGYKVSSCPSVPDWEVGRNNAYGYNYKYLGSGRENDSSPTAPFERFPVKEVRSPAKTIAFGDSDGTGWTKPHENGIKDQHMLGNHGYTLDPTYIPDFCMDTYSAGSHEPYSWHNYRGYISDRHRGGSNACFVDGHAERIIPKDVYQDNRYWNGLGFEDPELDPHVDERLDPNTGEFRYDLEDPCQP